MSSFDSILLTIAVNAVPLVLAITLHEAAHGYVARMFGDNTAYAQGRVSLNPARHIDPIGTVLFPLLSLLSHSGVFFGWAKPVPVNFSRLRHPKRDSFWVALAGPGSNFAQALVWAGVAKVIAESASAGGVAELWFAVCVAGVSWNVVLMIFNLIPILPLDGGRMLVSVLPPRQAYALSRTEPYGMFILIGLMVLIGIVPVLGYAYGFVLRTGNNFFYSLFGLQ